MPVVAFKPTKARLVIEQGRESVLVMRVLVAKGETVALAAGGRLESSTGSLRIRERKEERGHDENKAVGSIFFVLAVGDGDERSSGNFQINVSMSAAKFEALLKIAISGRLPTKFFVHAGDPISAPETRGMGYAIRSGRNSGTTSDVGRCS